MLSPHALPTDWSKIAFMISHLTGRAKAWGVSEMGPKLTTLQLLHQF